jgi:hypothetical protein
MLVTVLQLKQPALQIRVLMSVSVIVTKNPGKVRGRALQNIVIISVDFQSTEIASKKLFKMLSASINLHAGGSCVGFC